MSKGKDIKTGLDAEAEVNTSSIEVNTDSIEINTRSEKVSTGNAPVVVQTIHLEEMVAKRVQEEEELTDQQAQRMAQVHEAAQRYIEEDWDNIIDKLEANKELVKDVLGEDISSKDYAKRMVDMINQNKKYYAEQKAKAKRSKP
ncbi:hypothetical protein Tco_0284243, partial [Tanacetum coccineum]